MIKDKHICNPSGRSGLGDKVYHCLCGRAFPKGAAKKQMRVYNKWIREHSNEHQN